MKLKLEKFKKGELNIPLIYFLIFSFLFTAGYIFVKMGYLPPYECQFKKFTGYPCPTCGSTRLVLSIYNFDIASAFKYNPFIFLSGIILALWSLTGFLPIFFKKKIVIELNNKEKKILIILIGILFTLNWIYLILVGI